jgi:hypothetical protein
VRSTNAWHSPHVMGADGSAIKSTFCAVINFVSGTCFMSPILNGTPSRGKRISVCPPCFSAPRASVFSGNGLGGCARQMFKAVYLAACPLDLF